MHPLQKQFHDFISTQQLVVENGKILLAVSGGLDSMVMLDLFSKSEMTFAVAHCNFGLRGESSDGDEAFVIDWTQERDIHCHVKKIKISGQSIQLEAREKRYEWFHELSDDYGYNGIATAHHLDDSMETTLLNIIRGTGVKGLKGIAVKNGIVIRPLLFATKAQLLDYAHEQKLVWREDASNQKTDYHRNKVRLEVIPKFKELNPSLLETYRNTKERLEMAAEVIQGRVNDINDLYFDASKGKLSLEWITQPTDLLILAELLSGLGFNYATAKEVFEAIGKSGKQFPGEHFTLLMDREVLYIQEEESTDAVAAFQIEGEGSYDFNNQTLEVQAVIRQGLELKVGRDEALLAREKLSFPLTIRRWEEGDALVPLGMKGSKKVSDVLIDEKVALAKKANVYVLESKGKIAWVIGYRVSEEFKVSEKTSEVIRVRFN